MTETVVTLFGLPVTGYGIGCALALLWGLIGAGIWCRHARIGYAAWIRLAVLTIPCVWLCSRLVFVLGDLVGHVGESSYYLDTLDTLAPALRFWDGGYSLMGALLGAILAAWLCDRWVHPRGASLLDAVGLGAPLAIIVERIFEQGTGMGLGREVEAEGFPAWLAVDMDGVPLYPVCLLEAAVAALIFLVLTVACIGLAKGNRRPGNVLRGFLVMFGLTQVLLESLRDDGHMVVHFVRVQQVIAILLAVGAMIAWSRMIAAQGRGRGLRLAGWGITLVCIGLAVWAEFGVDRWGNRLAAYGLMAACLTGIGIVAWCFNKRANHA